MSRPTQPLRGSGKTTFADGIHGALDVQHEREQLEFRVEAMLRDKGWKHTSSTPGCIWLWEREIDGRVLLVNKETALAVQRTLELDAIDEEEDDDG